MAMADRETFTPITLQRVFSTAWEHFIDGDDLPAIDAHGECQYRTTDGRRCAIGLCIPDDHPALNESASIPALNRKYPGLFSGDLKELTLAQELLHDKMAGSGRWLQDKDERERVYVSFAYRFGLKIPGRDVAAPKFILRDWKTATSDDIGKKCRVRNTVDQVWHDRPKLVAYAPALESPYFTTVTGESWHFCEVFERVN